METSTISQSPAEAQPETAAARTGNPRERARRRGAVLARMLAAGDALAALLAASIALLLLGSPPSSLSGAAYIAACGLLWPVVAFSIGLYRSDQLSAWASAISEVPRAFVAVMLITWPLFGVATVLGVDQNVALTFLTVVATAALAAVSRTLVRAGLHRVSELRPRRLILGSGVVAGQLVKKLEGNAQFGLVAVGMVDDEVHNVGAPELPWPGRFEAPATTIEKQLTHRGSMT